MSWLIVAVGMILLAILISILVANDGTFVYTLDDPYIHLQFSTQIWRGHFGLVPEETASPSSSILWPLLLAPFSSSGWHEFLPLVFNLCAVLAAAALWHRTFARFVLEQANPASGLHAGVLSVLAIFGTGGFHLPFSGMEHSLQALATLAALAGAIELIETGRVRWWMLAGIIAGPLLRYENVPISATALAVLATGGAWLWAGVAALGVAAGLGGFALVSAANGLPPLPGSIFLKTHLSPSVSDVPFWARYVSAHFFNDMLRQRRGISEMVLAALLAVWILWPHSTRLGLQRWCLLVGVIATMGLQLVFGAHAQIGRYDSYAYTAGLLGCAYFFRHNLQAFVSFAGAWRTALVGAMLLTFVLPSTILPLIRTPLAAQDIYRQQWQMRRFLQTLDPTVIAVNDVGLTSYRSPHAVVDLMGLGSKEIMDARRMSGGATEQIKTILQRRGVTTVLIYPIWFSLDALPPLIPIAEFDLGRNSVTAASGLVVMYATSQAAADYLRQKAIAFAPSMPRGTQLKILPP